MCLKNQDRTYTCMMFAAPMLLVKGSGKLQASTGVGPTEGFYGPLSFRTDWLGALTWVIPSQKCANAGRVDWAIVHFCRSQTSS